MLMLSLGSPRTRFSSTGFTRANHSAGSCKCMQLVITGLIRALCSSLRHTEALIRDYFGVFGGYCGPLAFGVGGVSFYRGPKFNRPFLPRPF